MSESKSVTKRKVIIIREQKKKNSSELGKCYLRLRNFLLCKYSCIFLIGLIFMVFLDTLNQFEINFL